MGHEELIDYAKRKKLTGRLLVIFILVMGLLTFFSNTINNFMLPRVVLDSPGRGALIKEISGEGTIEAKSVIEEYINTNLKVLDVNVQVGDTVKKGQPILSLDIDNLRSSLQEEDIKYRQMKIALERLKDDSNMHKHDRNIESALEDLEKQKKYYQNIKTLYDSGFESENELKNAEMAMNNAQRAYDSSVQDKEEFTRDSLRDIENAQLNLEMEALRIDTLKKEMANNGVYTAPADGVITELNFSKGTMANSSKPLFKLAEASGGFQLSISVNRDLAAYVKAGDEVDISITSLGDKRVEGSIAQIKDDLQDGDNKELLIDVNSEELQGGEKGQVVISKRTEQYHVLVPNSAVYTDSDGSYVYIVKKVDSPLGTESYVQRMVVTVKDSDSSKSAVDGVMSLDKLVTGSTKPLSDGDRVVVEQ